MRHFLLLAPLGMLLLSSCEPEGGSSDAGSIRQRKPEDKWKEKLPKDEMSNAQLAAESSVGKAPLARNLAANVGDTCPVHHMKMKVREIPILHEEAKADGTGSANLPATVDFPFGDEKIVSTANALLPGEPLTARVYQCAACITARRVAEGKAKQSAPPARSD